MGVMYCSLDCLPRQRAGKATELKLVSYRANDCFRVAEPMWPTRRLSGDGSAFRRSAFERRPLPDG